MTLLPSGLSPADVRFLIRLGCPVTWLFSSAGPLRGEVCGTTPPIVKARRQRQADIVLPPQRRPRGPDRRIRRGQTRGSPISSQSHFDYWVALYPCRSAVLPGVRPLHCHQARNRRLQLASWLVSLDNAGRHPAIARLTCRLPRCAPGVILTHEADLPG
ncbi:hypothetical protein VTG60DRAFT_5655 [Thermothelomyces hinnuleus]